MVLSIARLIVLTHFGLSNDSIQRLPYSADEERQPKPFNKKASVTGDFESFSYH